MKLIILILFVALGAVILLDDGPIVVSTSANSTGPPPGFTGAPDENSCTACHFGGPETGTFSLTVPTDYIPGQTYQIVIRHVNADTSRKRWGFEMTALAGTAMAGSFSNLSPLTQTISDSGRQYIEHTLAGTFPDQTGGAQWTVQWTAPTTNVGPVNFYAAGNQANNDGQTGGDRIITTTAVSQPETPGEAPLDLDGDGKTDIGITRTLSSMEWWFIRSSNGSIFAAAFGAPGDVMAPGDFTGDGKMDITIFRPSSGTWFVLRSEDLTFFGFPFGADGDIAAPADYDGDNRADAAVFRPSVGTWFILRSTGGIVATPFGLASDKPVPSDYDGDGNADIAIFRPIGASGAEWWIQRSTAGLFAVTFGASTDKAVPGDYTGDGKTDVAFWRPSTGTWFILRSEDVNFFGFPWGASSDIPAPGDYDGDGKFDAAVFRPAIGTWFVNRSTAGQLAVPFGANGDIPVPNAFVR